MDLGLRGRKAIVTGASRGIGRAIAQALADEGVDLAVCARNAAGLDAARKDLETRGVRVVAKPVDVADAEALRAFVTQAIEDLGGLDVLVSNPSGGNGTDEASWRANFEVDLMGAVRAVDAALPALAASDAPSVIFISTAAAVETFMGPTSYNAIKAALIRHASGLAQALGPRGIRVNTVSPGPIYFEGGAWAQIEKAAPKMYENALAAIPTGRMGTPEEVAACVTFLASPRSSLVTGQNLVTDGGYTKRVDF